MANQSQSLGRKTPCYLSLGSNQGSRYAQLQRAAFALDAFSEGGVTCSSLYLNPAQGFVGPDFLNAAVFLETSLSLEALWAEIRRIESSLGKLERNGGAYASRPIDIDLIFFGDAVIQQGELHIPHPRFAQRRFVLTPLLEIAPELVAPGSGKALQQLLDETPDPGPLYTYPLPLYPSPISLLRGMKGICIEGNIGIGKTTLAQGLSQALDIPLVLERFAQNPFLAPYYAEPQRYAFPVEMYFLYDRVAHWKEIRRDLGTTYISDFHLHKSRVFARSSLQGTELKLFESYFHALTEGFDPPELLLFLEAPEELLLHQIAARGRPFEQSIPKAYLRKIQEGYRDLLPEFQADIVLALDRTAWDFTQKEPDLKVFIHWLAEAVAQRLDGDAPKK